MVLNMSNQNVPDGFYLQWAAYIPLTPADFERPGWQGLWLDIGKLGDDLFLRSPCHEREGLAEDNHRWTQQVLEVEWAVWPDRPGRSDD